jgi:RsiW-degrading membrane proteinase PrsW (M82 family)
MAKSVPEELRAKMAEGATREPPAPWHNRLLAREAAHERKLDEAAKLFEREGLAFEERRTDVDAALQIWIVLDAWDHVRARLADPRVAAAADPHTKYQLAVHDGDWKGAARWLLEVWRPRFTPFGLAMAATCALAWAFFCARLGKLGERPKRRALLYLAAFVLGVASVAPTAAIIAIEEAKLRLVETGDAGRDVLFFVFGVGLREEAAKLLLFLPLLFFLRRGGKSDKLDVLVCGAMVGLGFAAEENLGYLAQPNVHGALARFLTANFFHMAATGVLAMALDDFLDDRERHARDFTRVSLLVVGMHGAYDFLLVHQEMGGSFLAMAVFVFLARMFLGAVDVARQRVDRTITLLHAFVFAVAVVVGVSFAHAFVAAGLTRSVGLMAEGLLGLAVIVFVFVRTLREM